MDNHNDKIYLDHILNSIQKIKQYVAGIDKASFKTNTLLQDAVVRQIEIIGEASKRVSPEFKSKYAHIPWLDISGMRNRIAHDYMNVDIDGVWITATQDIVTLEEQLKITPNNNQ